MTWLVADPDIFFCSKVMTLAEDIPYFSVGRVLHNTPELEQELAGGGVQGLFMDINLPGAEAMDILENATLDDPLTVVVIAAGVDDAMTARLHEAGAQVVLKKPLSRIELLTALQREMPALRAQDQLRTRFRTGLWLDYLGLSRSLQGHRLLCEAAALQEEDPLRVSKPRQMLYPLLALRCQCTPAAAERNIRTAIESLWLYGRPQVLYDLMEDQIPPNRAKPTNRQMIGILHVLSGKTPGK